MKRFVEFMVAVVIALIIFIVTDSLFGRGSCSITSVCPAHGVSTTFTGQTRLHAGGCIYGKYSHGACSHWTICYCAGE